MSSLKDIAQAARTHSDAHPHDIDYRLLADLAEELYRRFTPQRIVMPEPTEGV